MLTDTGTNRAPSQKISETNTTDTRNT